jgi:hypothetical protein
MANPMKFEDFKLKREQIEKQYHQQRGIQKYFTFNDVQNAVNDYQKVIQKNKKDFTEEEKQLAVEHYKMNNQGYLERENTIQNYLTTNFGLEFEPSEELKKKTEDKSFWEKLTGFIDNTVLAVPKGIARGTGQLVKIIGDSLNELDTWQREFGSNNRKALGMITEEEHKEELEEIRSEQKFQLGQPFSNLGNSIQGADILETEYTRGIKSGEYQQTFKDYRWWFNSAPEVVGQAIGAMGLTVLTPGIPDEFVVGGKVIQKIMALMKSVPMATMYSASEANNVRNQALEQGYSWEEASKKASTAFQANMGLMAITGALPGVWTSKIMKNTNKFNQVLKTDFSRRMVGIGTDAFMEGFEEVAQEVISNSSLEGRLVGAGEHAVETFLLGMVGGGFGGAMKVAQELSFEKTYDKYVQKQPLTEKYKNEFMEQGYDEITSKDMAMSKIRDFVKNTPYEQLFNNFEIEGQQEATAESVIKPLEAIEKNKEKLQLEAKQEFETEKQNSRIEGFDFNMNEKGERTYKTPNPKTIESSSDIAISNFVAQELANQKGYQIDEVNNTITTKESTTEFAQEVKDTTEVYTKMTNMIKNFGTEYNKQDIKNYASKNKINNKQLNKMYEAKAINTKEYANALKQLDMKSNQPQIQKNIDLSKGIESFINNPQTQNLKSLNKLKSDIEQDFNTLNDGLDTLADKGYINKTDKNALKQLDKELIAKQEQDALKTLEDTTAKQEETITKQKEQNKQLQSELALAKKQIAKEGAVVVEETVENSMENNDKPKELQELLNIAEVQEDINGSKYINTVRFNLEEASPEELNDILNTKEEINNYNKNEVINKELSSMVTKKIDLKLNGDALSKIEGKNYLEMYSEFIHNQGILFIPNNKGALNSYQIEDDVDVESFIKGKQEELSKTVAEMNKRSAELKDKQINKLEKQLKEINDEVSRQRTQAEERLSKNTSDTKYINTFFDKNNLSETDTFDKTKSYDSPYPSIASKLSGQLDGKNLKQLIELQKQSADKIYKQDMEDINKTLNKTKKINKDIGELEKAKKIGFEWGKPIYVSKQMYADNFNDLFKSNIQKTLYEELQVQGDLDMKNNENTTKEILCG